MKWYQNLPVYAAVLAELTAIGCNSMQSKSVEGTLVNDPIFITYVLANDTCKFSIEPTKEDRVKFGIKKDRILFSYGGPAADKLYLNLRKDYKVMVSLDFGEDPADGVVKITSLDDVVINGKPID